MVKRPTLVRVLLKDYKTKEDVNALLEQLSEASRAAEQDLYAEYPKLPRKAKKELKKRLNAVNNAGRARLELAIFGLTGRSCIPLKLPSQMFN